MPNIHPIALLPFTHVSMSIQSLLLALPLLLAGGAAPSADEPATTAAAAARRQPTSPPRPPLPLLPRNGVPSARPSGPRLEHCGDPWPGRCARLASSYSPAPAQPSRSLFARRPWALAPLATSRWRRRIHGSLPRPRCCV